MRQFVENRFTPFSYAKAQTLMEVLIGIGVMAIVITGIAGLVGVSLQSARLSREKSIAQSLLNDMSAAVKGIVQSDWHDLFSSNNGLGYWSLDDGSGSALANTVVLDHISGNNGVLTIGTAGPNGAVASAWQSGANCKAGSCFSLDGTDDYMSIPDADNLDGMSQVSVFVWAKRGRLTDYERLAGKYYYSAGHTGSWVMFENGASDSINCTFKIGGSWVTASGAAEGFGTTGDWYHLGCVYDGSYLRVYINGLPSGTPTSASGLVATSTYPLSLGTTTNGTSRQNYFAGSLDEARLYSRALSAAEVANLYRGVNSFYATQTFGTWRLQEGVESRTQSNIIFTRSFTLEPVMRDVNNNIVSFEGSDDPLSRKVIYTVNWNGHTLSQQEYVSRIGDSVFTQSDWSAGLMTTSTVFTAPTGFVSASSGIIYSVAGSISNQLGSVASSSINNVYRYAWNDIASWIDFYPVTYSNSSTEFTGSAASALGDISLNCLGQLVCDSSNYKTYQKTGAGSGYAEGELYGYGWSGVWGWLSFNCNQTGVGGATTCSTVNYKTYITTSTGDFNGFAWNDVIGWVSFNCNDLSICGVSDYKVKLNLGVGSSISDSLESAVFDTQAEGGVVPIAFVWQGTLHTNNQVRFQLASANNPAGPWNFVGADGTGSSYYPGYGSAQPNTFVPLTAKYHFNHRYLRYKIFLTSSDIQAPLVQDVSLLWKQ